MQTDLEMTLENYFALTGTNMPQQIRDYLEGNKYETIKQEEMPGYRN